MTVRSIVCTSTLMLALGGSTPTSAPREALLVSPSWLAQHLTDPNVVVLHVGDRAEYDARHIPGARLVATADLSISDRSGKGLTLEVPPADDLRQRLMNLGISDNSRVIVYYGKDWVSPSTRVIFTLDYAGLGDATSLLDGGMDAWIRDGRPVTSDLPPARTGTLSPLGTRPLVVDAEFVRAHLTTPGFAVVDGRLPPFYNGAQTGGSASAPHRTGHIAGARSVPFSSMTDDQLKLRSTPDLEAAFTNAGVKRGDTVIAYCHIGQQATAVIFAARVLGHPVLLYDGSFEDWSRHADYPVENPSRTGGGQ